MLKAIKIKLYPNNTTKGVLNGHLGTCRFVYNKLLATSVEQYNTDKTHFSIKQANTLLAQWKGTEETKFIKETYAQVLQQTIMNLDSAFKNFFRRCKTKKGGDKLGFPKYKSKKQHRDTCRFTNQSVKFSSTHVQLTGKLKNIPFRCSDRDTVLLNTCHIVSATLTHTPSGDYMLSVCIDNGIDKATQQPINKAVGIDLGISHFAILSNGTKIDNPKMLRSYESRLIKSQRVLSKRVKGGSNWNKQRLVVARCHERVHNSRVDFLHKLSTRLSREFDTICIEDLNVRGMVKNRKLSKNISDCSWSEFTRQLDYKCNRVLRVDRFFPSSKTCSCCGRVYNGLKLSEREWFCSECGTLHDRDVNASLNILRECLTHSE